MKIAYKKSFLFKFYFLELNKPSIGVKLSPDDQFVNFEFTRDSNSLDIETKTNRVLVKMNTIDDKWIHQNKDTFISYSCSEGL